MSDKKIPVEDNGRVVSYEPELRSVSDYAPFGMQMVGRSYSAGGYRYGFNGKEKSDEVYGEGNVYDYGFRIYNPRIGKFLSVDPLQGQYPELTPYQFASNSPIQGVDLDGREIYHYRLAIDKGGTPKLTYLGEQTRKSGWWEVLDYSMDNWKSFNGEKIKGQNIYVHTGMMISDAPMYTFEYFKGFIDWIQAGYPAKQQNDNTAAELSRNATTTLTFMELSQRIDQADGDNDGYVNPNNYGKDKSPSSSTNKQATAANNGNGAAANANKSTESTIVFEGVEIEVKATVPYKRPNNATTVAQRKAVNQPNSQCATCGTAQGPFIADHKNVLAIEHISTGTIDKTKMRSLDAVQPQCGGCSLDQSIRARAASKQANEIIKRNQTQTQTQTQTSTSNE